MNDESLPGPHNRFFLQTFSRLDLAAALLANYLPPATLATLDLNSLKLATGSFIDDELRESSSDLLFEVSRVEDEEPVLVYVLTEHKSYQDSLVAFQVLKYMVRIWEQRLRDGEPMCVIIPLVVYHGETKWTTSRTMDELVPSPEPLNRYLPKFDIQMVDLCELNEDELGSDSQLKSILMLLKYIRSPTLADRLIEVLGMISNLVPKGGEIEYLKTVIIYLATATTQINREQLVSAVRRTLEQQGELLMPTIAQQWTEEGRQEGRQEGIVAGQISLFENLLGKGTTPAEELIGGSLPELRERLRQLEREYEARRQKPE